MGNGNAFIYSERSILQSSKTDYEQRTETIDIKPTPGTALGTWLTYKLVDFSTNAMPIHYQIKKVTK